MRTPFEVWDIPDEDAVKYLELKYKLESDCTEGSQGVVCEAACNAVLYV